MTSHNLIKHSSTLYECRVCGQTWKTKPKARCPGLKVYQLHAHLPLITKGQLSYYGYQTSEKYLPPPAGCYLLDGFGSYSYIMLYDPRQAVKKDRRSNPRKRIAITEIFWPVKLLPLLEDFHARDKELLHITHGYTSHMTAIANMIIHFAAFTPDEISHLAGKCVHFVFSPVDVTDHYTLVSRTTTTYERQKDAL
jgi:hypothetical protein